MNADKIANIASMIVVVALVTTIVSRKNSAEIIKATGRAFSGAISAAQGR